MKLKLSIVLLIIGSIYSFSQVNEDFDGWVDGSYGAISTFNGWESNKGLTESTNARSGDCVRLRNSAGSYLEYVNGDGFGKDGGVGTISFWYRSWDSSPTAVYDVQASINGNPYANIGMQISTTSTTYAQWSFALNNSSDNIKIKVLRVSGERLLIDDFEITNYSVPCSEPTSDSTFHVNSPQSLTTTSATLNWTSGDGANRIVVMREINPIIFNPTDNSTYTANTAFGTGADVGTNEYVVYNGNSNTVDVTNLTPGTIYHVTIYEYNCNIGSEDYYTSGTPTTDMFITNPENPDNFTSSCITDTTIELSWSVPSSGNFDGYLLVVRDGATPHSVNSLDPNTALSENTDYTIAATYGATSPNSRILYKGLGTSTTITGLTLGSTYTFKIYAYTTNGSIYRYSSGTITNQTIQFQNVTNGVAISSDSQIDVSWVNPDNSCFDEILVIANVTNGISFLPSGNGSTYIPNTVYSAVDQVVFNSNGSSVAVTNLVNGTTYYFEIFVRNGTTWSSGIEVSATPNSETIFEPGDLVIVGYDNKVGVSDDVVTILNLVDVLPNTTFWYSNATYEIGANANQRTEAWRSCTQTPDAVIGSQQFTYLGPTTLPAGSTFCITIDNNQILAADFTVHQASGSGTYNFSDGLTPAGFATSVNISTSKPDSIFLMQGNWSADLGGFRLFDGTVLGGIQDGADWYTITDDLSSIPNGSSNNRISRIPPEIECFAIQGTTSSGKGFAYYDDIKTESQVILLGKINDFATNWVQGVGDGANDIAGTSCDSSFIFSITSVATAGVWTNAKNDNNWFNCGNWENLSVPDETVNVVINVLTGSDKAVIDDDAADADVFQKIAKCKNLTINGEKLELIGDVDDVLEIHGDLTITNGILNMDDLDTSTADGTVQLYGNWTNNTETNFNEGNSTINFIGTTAQTVSSNTGSDTEKFYNISLNNTNGVSFLSNNIHAAGDLHIINNTSPITVTANHYILAGNILKNDNNTHFIIQDDASFVQTKNGADTNTGVNNSTFEIHKTTTPYVMYDYTYWSSPVNSAAIGTVFSANNPNYIYSFTTANFSDDNNGAYPQNTGAADSYDDTGDDWNLESGTMTKGKGYIVMGSGATFPVTAPTLATSTQSVVFENSTVNNGIIPINVSLDLYNTTNGSGNSFNKNDNLVGNPYPSAISASKFLTANPNLGGTIYFWTHDTAISTGVVGPNYYNFTNDDYATWNSSGGIAAHVGSPAPTGNIASCQGFFVTATVAEQIHFDNDMRVINSNNLFYRPQNRIWLDFTNNNGLFRQILIGFFDDATDDKDRLFDGLRLENGTNWDFYSQLNNEKMAIQGLANFSTEKTIPLGVEIIQTGNFEISINHLEGYLEETSVYLKDNLLNITHDLKVSNYQVFINTTGNIDNRFELVFQRNTLNTDNITVNQSVFISNTPDDLIKVNATNKIKNIKAYDILGKLIIDNNYSSKELLIQSNINTGTVLLFKITLENGSILKKKFIKY